MVTKPNTFTTGQLPTGPQWDANFTTLYDYLNGNVEASSIVSASFTTTKFADGTITAGKLTTDIDFTNTQEFCFQESKHNNSGNAWIYSGGESSPIHNFTYWEFPSIGAAVRVKWMPYPRNGVFHFGYINNSSTVFTSDTIDDESGTETVPANRISTMTGTHTFGATTVRDHAFMCIYNNSDSRWILLGATP